MLLVSNNPYALGQPAAPGTRPALDTGQLGVLVLDAPADRPHPPARAWTAAHLEVAASATVHAGIDGEAAELSGPLRFAVRPGLAARPDLPPPPRRVPVSADSGRGQSLRRLPRPAPG